MTVQFNVELIRILQERIAPDIFTPRVIYDGRKSIFRSRALNLSGGDSQAVSHLSIIILGTPWTESTCWTSLK